MAKTEKRGLDGMKVTSIEVIHKESEGSVIVRDEDGTTESILTNLPEVEKGHGGKILEIDGRKILIREPYGW